MSNEAINTVSVKAPAVKVVFKPVSWLKKIDFVKRLVLDNNILISLIGEPGRGKTTFATLLQESLPPQIMPYKIPVSPLFDREIFLQQLSVLLTGSDGQSISGFIAESNEKKQHTLLIIDDAHHLSADFIEEILFELKKQGSSGYFHVFMISDFSLVSILTDLAEEKYKDMIHSIEVGPLNESEIKTYVLQNLLLFRGVDKIISDERAKQFLQLTQGHLLEINREMAAFFSDLTILPSSQKPVLFNKMSVAAGVFLSIVGAAYFLQSKPLELPSTQLVKQQGPQLNALPVAQIEKNSSSDVPAYYVAAVRQEILPTPLHREKLVETSINDASDLPSMVIMDKVVVAPKVIVQHNSLPIEKSKPVPVRSLASLNSVKLKPLVEQSRYTIQLIASHKRDELRRFIQLHHIKGKTQVRLTKRKGTVWYVLTMGEYSKRQHAKQAVSHLPKDIVQFKPWVRLVSDLKAVGAG